MKYASSVSRTIATLLEGASDPDPEQFGKTTEEELSQAGILQVIYSKTLRGASMTIGLR